MTATLILSNYDPDTDTVIYSNDFGSWNVSRALRDCAAGKHKLWRQDVKQVYRNNRGVTVDKDKVAAIAAQIVLSGGKYEPLLGVMENGACWFIDGHHRLRALHRLGVKDFSVYIIEEEDSKPYIVWYNGQRKPPFALY